MPAFAPDTSFSLARRLQAGEIVHAGWCAMPYPLVVEMIGRAGFPAVTLDAQHGLWDTATIAAGIATLHQAGSAPIVRIPVGGYGFASRALDFGAEAIIAPMINTAADARAFAAATKYPPLGERSWGPHRATTLGGFADQKDYLAAANELTVTFGMIETRTALDNLDAIAGTPGLDGLFLGPSDLSIALSGGRTLDPFSPEVDAEIDRIVAAAENAGKIPGAFCPTPDRAVALAKRGMRFLAIGSDMSFLRNGAAAALATIRKG